MIGRRAPEEITEWLLAFHTWSPSRLVSALIPGRFKHVTAFAWSPQALTWLFLDLSLNGARVILLPYGDHALAELGRLCEGSSVLKVKARPRGARSRVLVFGCVGAVKHLLSIRCGAVRPDSLWRFLVANGAEIVVDGFPQAKQPAAARAAASPVAPAETAQQIADQQAQSAAALKAQQEATRQQRVVAAQQRQLIAAQTQQVDIANQSAAQANTIDTQQIQSGLGDSQLNMAMLFGMNARAGGMSPLVGGRK